MKAITALQACILERNLTLVENFSQTTPMAFDRLHYTELQNRGYLTISLIEDKQVWLATSLGKTALMCYRAQLTLNVE